MIGLGLKRGLGVLAPKGWRDFALQAGVLAAFEPLYALSGLYGREKAKEGLANARGLLALEHRFGIAWEQGVQRWVLHGPHVWLELANRTYFLSQFTVTMLFLLWVYARRNEHFGLVRNALVAANGVSMIVLFLYPLAPPRMLPDAGFVDTLNANRVNLHTPLIDALNNPYSAMPSLHASYAVVLGIAGVALTRSRWLKAVWALYPLLVFGSVVATGNHFVLDIAAGVLALLATPAVGRLAGGHALRANRLASAQLRPEQGDSI